MYDDWTGSPRSTDFTYVPGRAAGDAMFFTRRVMGTFAEISGYTYCGYDNQCSTAKVVVDTVFCLAGPNNSHYALVDEDYAPTHAVAVCGWLPDPDQDGHTEYPYHASAAIDVIGHEWGHAVIESRGIGYNDGAPQQKFHEGYADIIGYMVEGLRQPWAASEAFIDEFEKFEWEYSEDYYQPNGNDQMQRRTPLWRDSEHKYWSLHRDDECQAGYGPNCKGSRLVEVLYLLTIGGYNKICEDDDHFDGCEYGATTPVSVTPLDPNPETAFYIASRILFHALVNSLSGILWDQDWLYRVGVPVGQSALDLDYGEDARDSVYQAFTAIGYPPNTLKNWQ